MKDAIADFANVKDDEWCLRKEKVSDTNRVKYAYSNISGGRPRPFKFRLDGEAEQSVLAAAANDMEADWDQSMLQFHPGFNSFSNTVGGGEVEGEG